MDNKLLRAKIAEMTSGKNYAEYQHRKFVADMLQTKFANGLRHLPFGKQEVKPAIVVTPSALDAIIRATDVPVNIKPVNINSMGNDWVVYPRAHGTLGEVEVENAAEMTAVEQIESKVPALAGFGPLDPYGND